MNSERRKELLESYKNRRPDMGLISYRCTATGQRFVNYSPDTKAAFNSTSFKLSTGSHPNKLLQNLWNQYGEAGFEITVLETLEYEETETDYSKKLKKLLEDYLEENPDASIIWHP